MGPSIGLHILAYLLWLIGGLDLARKFDGPALHDCRLGRGVAELPFPPSYICDPFNFHMAAIGPNMRMN